LFHFYSETNIYNLNTQSALSAPIAKQMVSKLQVRPQKERLKGVESNLM